MGNIMTTSPFRLAAEAVLVPYRKPIPYWTSGYLVRCRILHLIGVDIDIDARI